jgi:hypothetical protein
MLERQKRLNEVYNYLHSNKGIHTKAGFADAIKYARAYVSSALNGNEKYLTDKLFRSICGAFPETFNLDYLLNGDGRLLLDEPQFVGEEHPSPPIPSWADAFLDILAKQVKENEALNRELRQSIERANVLCANLETLISKL